MTDQQKPHAPDQHALVSAFAGRVSAARSGGGAKILAALLVAALAGGVVVGVGYLTRPAKKPHVPSSALGRRPATGPGPASPPPAARATTPARPAPAAPYTSPAPVTQPPPVTQSGPGQTWTAPPAQPSASPSSAPAQAARRFARPPRFVAVAGYGCPSRWKASFTDHGWWTDGLNGFLAVHSGGPRARGCDGSFGAMPMSGSTTYDDPGNYALWRFRTAPVVRGFCHINVYIPRSQSIEHVGGHPAVYQIFGSYGTSGQELGAFDIDQTFNRGRWVSSHNWQIFGGALTVKLDSYGIDSAGSTPTHAHIAMSAVSLTCVS